jgi:hypothetical protein
MRNLGSFAFVREWHLKQNDPATGESAGLHLDPLYEAKLVLAQFHKAKPLDTRH